MSSFASISFVFLLFQIVSTFGVCQCQVPIPEPVTRGEAPYHVSIQSTWNGLPGHSYSGVILDSRHILTVGNLYWSEGELSILVGRIDFQNPLTGYRRSVKNITYHPDFYRIPQRMGNQDFPPRNDLAILEVTVPLEFYEYAQPITLPLQGQAVKSTEGRWTEWGFNDFSGPVLQKITIPIILRSECEAFYGKYKITDRMFCVGYIDEETGLSMEVVNRTITGGPLVVQDDNGKDILYGISSYTPIYNQLCYGPTNILADHENGLGQLDCETVNLKTLPGYLTYPTAFVDVTYYVDWILETIK